jgi:hypothetical protein
MKHKIMKEYEKKNGLETPAALLNSTIKKVEALKKTACIGVVD